MFERIFIERDILDHPRTKYILNKLGRSDFELINNTNDVFGRVKKPYLQKRENLNLFIGRKKGNLVKQAPNAYGVMGDSHYYFIHSYNCLYECQYCYLQGYFHSPDLVLFINHEDICLEMEKIISTENAWFHAGEFSDSLALSHISGELPYYFDFFRRHPSASLELRTKSVNISELLKLPPADNIITSYSLSPQKASIEFDLKAPPSKHRLMAIGKLHQAGHPIGIHFDPIIYDRDFEASYRELISQLNDTIPLSKIRYLSLGVVRFTKDVFHQIKKNYPDSSLLGENFTVSFDHKVRYIRPMRLWMLNSIKHLLLAMGMDDSKIYFCME